MQARTNRRRRPARAAGAHLYPEKIHPQAIIDDLLAHSAAGGDGGGLAEGEASYQLDLFSDFNGLPEDFDQRVDFYAHDGHWSNRLILGDSLLVMASLAEKEGLKGKVQAIYFDPPYGIKFGSNWQVSTPSATCATPAEDATRHRNSARLPRHLEAGHPLLPGLPA